MATQSTPKVLIAIILVAASLPSCWAVKEVVIHNFDNIPDGADAIAGLIADANGNLYGVSWGGGIYGYGLAYELVRNFDGSWTETSLYSFTGGSDGGSPQSKLTFDPQGNLYGTTTFGGNPGCVFGCGTVFELSPNIDGSWTEKVIYGFSGDRDGYGPGPVVFDASGSLYGVAGGGTYKYGLVFELTPNQDGTWTEGVVHAFTGGADGGGPEGALVLDAAGSLYGATSSNGPKGGGTVYELTAGPGGSWTGSILHAFSGGRDGASPVGSLTFDNSGNLYGSSAGGTRGGGGVVFMLSPRPKGHWAFTALHEFPGPSDSSSGNLVFDQKGNLYGTTLLGGINSWVNGTAFRLSLGPNGIVVANMFYFDGPNGSQPASGVIIDSAGNLFGTTTGGGISQHCGNGCGTVFEITP